MIVSTDSIYTELGKGTFQIKSDEARIDLISNKSGRDFFNFDCCKALIFIDVDPFNDLPIGGYKVVMRWGEVAFHSI